MGDLTKFLPLLFFIFVAVSIARNVLKVAKKMNEQPPGGNSADSDPDLAERTRRIQAEIRRKIAERRGMPVPPPEPEPQIEVVEPAVPPPFLVVEGDPAEHAAILERQRQLSDQMRALEGARVAEQRRAAHLMAAETAAARSAEGQLLRARDELLADVRDPAGLRRAIVLREVLGPPVGLR